MTKAHVGEKVLLLLAVSVLAIILLTHVYLLGVGIYSDQFWTFWVPLVIMGLIVFYSALHYRSHYPLILIVLFALSLHLIQFVRQPSNMVWNPDAIYELQLVKNFIASGHWSYPSGTGEAIGYIFYPLLPIFESILPTVTSLSPLICVKYSMAFVNVLMLLTFCTLINGLFELDSLTRNLMVFFLALSPAFNGFDSYVSAESFAIILFPLLLLFIMGPRQSHFLKRRESNSSIVVEIVAILLLLTVTLSHHFTSYLVAFSMVVPIVLVMVVYHTHARWSIGRRNLILLAVILPIAWLIFVAGYILQRHIDLVLQIIRNLTSVQKLVGYSYHPAVSSNVNYPSLLSMQLTLVYEFLIFSIPIIGAIWYKKIREKETFKHWKFLLFSLLAVTILLSFFVNWTSISSADVRMRILAFTFFPIAFFFPLGLDVLSERASKFRRIYFKNRLQKTWKFLLKPTIAVMFIVVMVVPTVLTGFLRVTYDTTYQPTTISEFPVAAENQYALGTWIAFHIPPTSQTIEFAGSSSAIIYVLGYGLFNGTWLGISNATELSLLIPHVTIFYVVNVYNLKMPDSLGQTVDSSTANFLNGEFSRVYDNGPIVLFEHAPTLSNTPP